MGEGRFVGFEAFMTISVYCRKGCRCQVQEGAICSMFEFEAIVQHMTEQGRSCSISCQRISLYLKTGGRAHLAMPRSGAGFGPIFMGIHMPLWLTKNQQDVRECS